MPSPKSWLSLSCYFWGGAGIWFFFWLLFCWCEEKGFASEVLYFCDERRSWPGVGLVCGCFFAGFWEFELVYFGFVIDWELFRRKGQCWRPRVLLGEASRLKRDETAAASFCLISAGFGMFLNCCTEFCFWNICTSKSWLNRAASSFYPKVSIESVWILCLIGIALTS